ncbi:MAG: hypothetical protein H6624_17575 [Bdellovibrionaceae bacterium]|nr:hypothetical protein [Bdellovibrionales bacterium]MCB9086155.1 hypothetical protein [Pseudobdellovibrionaceae bacterium]
MASSSDTLFIQFYKTNVSTKILVNGEYINLIGDHKEYDLCNGFSQTHYSCKKRGDFLWYFYDLDGTMEEVLERNRGLTLPISRGTVYVSAFYNVHMYQAYLWAQEYPEIHFIVGGPAVDMDKVQGELPKNLELYEGTLHERFGEDPQWGIEIPKEISGKIMFSYPIEKNCYWGICTFCGIKQEVMKEPINYSFMQDLPPGNQYFVFLNTFAMSPEFMKNNLHKFRYKGPRDCFWTYVRADKRILEVLDPSFRRCAEEGFDLRRFWWLVGLEFPSNRMLKHMKKGTTLKNILEFCKIAEDHGTKLVISTIFGWNNLTKEDVEEGKEFLASLRDVTAGKALIRCHYLVSKPLAPMYGKQDLDFRVVKKGPFVLGKIPFMNDEQRRLNDEMLEFLYSCQFRGIREPYSDGNFAYDLL